MIACGKQCFLFKLPKNCINDIVSYLDIHTDDTQHDCIDELLQKLHSKPTINNFAEELITDALKLQSRFSFLKINIGKKRKHYEQQRNCNKKIKTKKNQS